MKIAVLDAGTLGSDLDLTAFDKVGETKYYSTTTPEEIAGRIADCDIIALNKVKITKEVIEKADKLKLICVFATGYDNVDISTCKEKGIAVCNVKGYSTDSVAQTTLALVFAIAMHLPIFDRFVKSGEYQNGISANKVEPVFYEMRGKIWGVVGCGNIGRQVAKVAEAIGCQVIGFAKTPKNDIRCVDIDTLCKQADIITLHLPLTEETNKIIGEKQLNEMKSSAILVNAARGKITDEKAVAEAIKKGKIAGFGTDVYSIEPITKDNPICEILSFDNVVVTPHLAWGAYEARKRCVDEVILNIEAFLKGEQRNRIV